MHRAFTEKNGKKVVEIAHTKFKKTNPELANSVKEIHVPIMPKCSPGGGAAIKRDQGSSSHNKDGH